MKRFILPVSLVIVLAGCGSQPSPLAGAIEGTNQIGGLELAGPVATEKTNASSAPVIAAETPATAAPVIRDAVPPAKPPPDLPVPAAEVVRLSQHVLGESVLIDYVGSINKSYTLNADQVIYLSDLGIPSPVIQALLKRSAALAAPAAGVAVPGPMVPAAEEYAEVPRATNSILTNYLVSTAGGAQAGLPYGALPPGGGGGGGQAFPMVQPPPVQQPVVEMAAGGPVDNAQIYSSLSPYGDWVEDPDYGWSWQPTVAVVDTGWRPYLNSGSWVWTDAGWYWNSTYSWGWLPFHYGRWTLAGSRGWIWVPDSTWGPAWVTWRSTDALCGWAPLPPGAYWRSGAGLYYHGRYVTAGFDFGLGEGWYCAVPFGSFCDPWPYRHCISGASIGIFIHGSRVIDDYRHGFGPGWEHERGHFVNYGPGVAPVQKATRSEVVKYNLNSQPRPGGGTPLPGRMAGGEPGGGHSLSVFRGDLPPVTGRPPSAVLARQSERQTHDTPYVASLAPRPAAPAQPSGERGGGGINYNGSGGRPVAVAPATGERGAGGSLAGGSHTIGQPPAPSTAVRPSLTPQSSGSLPSRGDALGSAASRPAAARPAAGVSGSNPNVFSHGEEVWARSSTTPRPISGAELNASGYGAQGQAAARSTPVSSYKQPQFATPQAAQQYSARLSRAEPPAPASNPNVFSHSEEVWARSSPSAGTAGGTGLSAPGNGGAYNGAAVIRPAPAGSYAQPAQQYSPPAQYYNPQPAAPVQRQFSAPMPAVQPRYSPPPAAASQPHSSGGGAQPQVSHPAGNNRHGN